MYSKTIHYLSLISRICGPYKMGLSGTTASGRFDRDCQHCAANSPGDTDNIEGRSRFIHFFVGYRFIHNQFFRLKRVDKIVKYTKKDRVDKMLFLMHILPFYPRCDCLEVTRF